MLKKVKTYIRKHEMFCHGNQVIVGVSGGADSMALLTCLNLLKDELGLTIIVAHMNHGLRGSASDADSVLTEQAAKHFNLPYYQKTLEPDLISRSKGLSLEDAARNERYAFFFHLLEELSADRIALGHQRHDQAETVLLNLLRGTGAKGLRGILPIRDKIIVRPLLGITRSEIITFLIKHKIPYREDESNKSNLFLRNRIRHELVPFLNEISPGVEKRLCRLADSMRIDNEYWDTVISDVLQSWGINPEVSEVRLSIKDFNIENEAVQRRIIKKLLENRSLQRNGIEHVHIDSVLKLAKEGHVGQKLTLPFQTEVIRHYDQIVIERGIRQIKNKGNSEKKAVADISTDKSFECLIENMSDKMIINWKDNRIRLSLVTSPEYDYRDPNIDCLDYERIEFPLKVRSIKPGDRIRPLGLKGTKKLKRFYVDRKIPQSVRENIPLLSDKNRIIWVGGLAIDEDVKVTPQTRTCLKIEII